MNASNLSSYSGKIILIAGGNGFIGSHLALSLCATEKTRVYVLARPQSSTWRLMGAAGKIDIIFGDLCDAETTKKIVGKIKPNIIINAAGNLNRTQSIDVLQNLITTNVTITQHLLDAAKEASVQTFIHIGTIDEYGKSDTPVIETMQEKPFSPYALSKLMATHSALLYHRMNELDVRIVRPSAVFGPMQGYNMLIPVFIQSCLKKVDFSMNPGKQIKNYIYIDDVVEGILLAGISPRAKGQIINLASDEEYTIKHVVTRINEIMGKPITIDFGSQPYRPFDPMVYRMNNEKAKKILNWRPRTPFLEAIKKTISWYTEHCKKNA